MSKTKKISDMKISEIDEKDIIKGFIATASMGFCPKEEIPQTQNVLKPVPTMKER